METSKGDAVTVLLLLALLTFVVVLVDDRWMRAAIAFVPAMLIVQRALAPSGGGNEGPKTGAAERREDAEVRRYIDQLLKHFREFYSTCHLMANGLIEPENAERRAGQLEHELNRLLAEVTDAARDTTPSPRD